MQTDTFFFNQTSKFDVDSRVADLNLLLESFFLECFQ